MSVLAGRPVLPCVKVPLPEPDARPLPVGLGEVPQTVPRSVTATPPSLETVPPNVAVVSVTAENVGADTVAFVVNELSPE